MDGRSETWGDGTSLLKGDYNGLSSTWRRCIHQFPYKRSLGRLQVKQFEGIWKINAQAFF